MPRPSPRVSARAAAHQTSAPPPIPRRFKETMSKQITYGEQSREAILRGIDSLANAEKVTLGPRGRNVMIGSSYGSPTLTKDGVTVAREIELKDPLENIGAQMV